MVKETNNTTLMQTNREQAFERLVQEHKDLIWQVCQDYSLSAAWTTKDAFQEVLCKLWKDMDKFKGQSSERTWVYRLATNTLREIKRKKSNQPTPEAPADILRTTTPPQPSDIERIIASLCEPDATIVRASLDGFDYREIAQITHLTIGAVAMRLSRAKQKIKTLLNYE